MTIMAMLHAIQKKYCVWITTSCDIGLGSFWRVRLLPKSDRWAKHKQRRKEISSVFQCHGDNPPSLLRARARNRPTHG